MHRTWRLPRFTRLRAGAFGSFDAIVPMIGRTRPFLTRTRGALLTVCACHMINLQLLTRVNPLAFHMPMALAREDLLTRATVDRASLCSKEHGPWLFSRCRGRSSFADLRSWHCPSSTLASRTAKAYYMGATALTKLETSRLSGLTPPVLHLTLNPEPDQKALQPAM